MLGVVLWSDAEDGKAVFWGEDQGDLAYFETAAGPVDEFMTFDAGDMVQFDVSVEQRLRRANNARLVQEQAYSGLPERLRQNAEPVSGQGAASAKVVPLKRHRSTQVAHHQRHRQKA